MPLTRAWRGLTLTVVLAIAAAPAAAASDAVCAMTTTPLAFGQYVPSRGEPADFTATLQLLCTAPGSSPAAVAGTISLVGGGGGSARELAGGEGRLRFQLFLDPARTIAWGDGGGGTRNRAITGTAGPGTPLRETITIYGRILARQSRAPVGQYVGLVTAVLNY